MSGTARRAQGGGERIGLLQLALGVAILLAWEAGGHAGAERWISRPALILGRLLEWAGAGLHQHMAITLGEIAAGLVIGTLTGALAGLTLGRLPTAAVILRPIVVGFYSVPLVALAPLFIMFFGLGMLPKIVLVSLVVFFLLFFNTFAGAQAIEQDLVDSMHIMGASRGEVFRKVVLPAASAWMLAGLRIAVPYALVAAITGELLATRGGIGFLISQSAERFDVTGLYAALMILMLLGLAMTEAAARYERHTLRWHDASR
jgi:NitT/TauT family transport system permease protein